MSLTRFSHIFAVFFLAILIISSVSPAASLDSKALTPQLGELQTFFQPSATPQSAQAVPGDPEWLPDARKQVQNLVLQQKVRSIPGARAYNLDNPPIRRYWWNYPIYAAIGFPRDLVDGLFGLSSNIMLINVATTGVMYEIVPTQVLARNWHDWHSWPFYSKINKNGHGWLDGKWGYFSNLHYTKFSSVNEKKLAKWRAYNEGVIQRLEVENNKVEAANLEIGARRQQYLRETRDLFKANKHREVIRRLVAYREIDPLNRDARAMLAVSLIHDLNEIPERQWAEQTLTDLLLGSSREVLIPVQDEIKDSQLADDENIARYLVAINMRLGNYAQAHSATQDLVTGNPSNVAYLRMQFETALATKDKALMQQAIAELEKTAGADSVAAQHARGRMAFALEKPDQAQTIYQRLAQAQPDNARFQYLLGMAYVEQGKATKRYDKGAALKALDKAVDATDNPEGKALYQKAYDAAKEFRAD